ncbi:hypothetical protein C0J52_00709 [Blattella germanica]|nr:hypothetical protein C0J52_00709 [Blattella germanica]
MMQALDLQVCVHRRFSIVSFRNLKPMLRRNLSLSKQRWKSTEEFSVLSVARRGWDERKYCTNCIRLITIIPRLLTTTSATCTIADTPDLCSHSELFLLVVVCSAVANFKQRAAIRDTWASAPSVTNSSNTIKVAFLLGDPDNSTLQEMVEDESLQYADIIQEGFVDSYNNLTLKSVMMLKWVSNHCASVRYIMKTDDDMFVNVDNLVRLLRVRNMTNLLVGALICNARPIVDTQNKYAPRYMYPGRVYPNYLSGTGYVMSRDIVPRLYKAALKTPLFHLEDVYLTGLCAHAAGIRPRFHPAFSYTKRKLDPCLYKDKTVVTSHHVNSSELRKVWTQMKNPQLDCSSYTTSMAAAAQKAGAKNGKQRIIGLKRSTSKTFFFFFFKPCSYSFH